MWCLLDTPLLQLWDSIRPLPSTQMLQPTTVALRISLIDATKCDRVAIWLRFCCHWPVTGWCAIPLELSYVQNDALTRFTVHSSSISGVQPWQSIAVLVHITLVISNALEGLSDGSLAWQIQLVFSIHSKTGTFLRGHSSERQKKPTVSTIFHLTTAWLHQWWTSLQSRFASVRPSV